VVIFLVGGAFLMGFFCAFASEEPLIEQQITNRMAVEVLIRID
jgi:hypothetical protein